MKTEATKTETAPTVAPKPAPTSSMAKKLARLDVPVGELHADPRNRMIDEADPDFVTLVESLKLMGVLVPVQAHRHPLDGRLVLVDGHRRWRAATKAGLPTVPCDVWPDGSQLRDITVASVIINDQRKAHSVMGIAKQLRAIKNEFCETHENVAARTGLPLMRVKLYLGLFEASDRVLDFLDDAQVPLRTAAEIVRYEKGLGADSARRLLERLRKEMLSAADIEALRKRREPGRSADPQKAAEKKPLKGPTTIPARFGAVVKKDPVAARKLLEDLAGQIGLQVVELAGVSLPPTSK